MIITIWVVVIIIVGCFWVRKKYSFFDERGINNISIIQSYGNLFKFMMGKEHFSESINNIYKAFPNDRFIGTYEFLTPSLFVNDPDLLRKIGVKDFDYFSDHRNFLGDDDPIFSKSLIGLKGQKWRDMRATLSPAFTGSKIKGMVPLIFECNKDLEKFVCDEIERSSENHIDIDTHDLLTRYTTDVIATCAFGLKANSITERDNHFYKMASKLTMFGVKEMLKGMVSSLPLIKKVIEINIFDKDSIAFLRHTVLDTMKNRVENNVIRPDVIQLLVEAKKGTLRHENNSDEKDAGFATVGESEIGKGSIAGWEDDYLVSQAFLFFFAGYDTVSTCMKFLILELAINPDIQDKLRQEINEYHHKYDGKIDYDKINQMKYLDMVLSENLRKWPPAVNIERVCVKPYNLGKPNDKAKDDFIVHKGMSLGVGVFAIHHDPQYYPYPERFDPERFSDENKKNITPFTYLPFGLGPRNCIASRFALLEVKIMIYDLIRNFEVSPAPQTLLPPRFDKKSLQPKLEGGHWFRFKCVT